MKIAIDLGGSTVDLIVFDRLRQIQQKHSLESNAIDRRDILGILKKIGVEIDEIENLRVTGGFSLSLPQKIENIVLEKIPEFDANGCGGMFLANTQNCLVVSLGTGTSMVKVVDGKIQHIGGTGVGGGTLLGLGKFILDETDYHKIDALAMRGSLRDVDLSVADIVGGKIGMLSENATASNFGKFKSMKKTDLALGICNLIGETIGSLAYFASQKDDLEKIVLIGKVTRVKSILKIIQNTSKVYNKEILVPENASFGTAIGAGMWAK